jgi:4-amino-4-deoxy-L-arabinose transferase-like glycosyltransferase
MKLNRTVNIYIIFAIWFLIQAIIIYNNGIITVGEAEKYISEAHIFLNTGKLSVTNYRFYFTQIFLLSIAFKTGWGFVFVLIVQLLFSAWATWSFFRLAEKLFSLPVALIGTIILLLNYPLQEFNTYVQTDSIFHSITIIFTSYLLRLSKITLLNFLTICIVVPFICITRPTGLLFVPAIGLYLLYRYVKSFSNSMKTIFIVVAAIVFLIVINSAIGSKGEWDFMLPYFDEHIICGAPTLNHNADIKMEPNGNSVYGLFYYITHNFEQFSRMAFLRSKAFFGLQRSYYGTGHNLFLAFFFYPLYALAIFSLKWWYKNKPYLLLYLVSAIAMTWITTFLTCDDWHNRWFLSISPWVILLGLPAITKLFTILTSYGPKRDIQQ